MEAGYHGRMPVADRSRVRPNAIPPATATCVATARIAVLACLVSVLSACAGLSADREDATASGTATAAHAEGAAPTLPASAAVLPAATPASRTLLLVSLDGFRPGYLSPTRTPNLWRLRTDGVHARWMRPSYPSLTFPNHYTLVTGLRPDRHGVVHNSMVDAELGTFRVADRDAVGDGRWFGDGEPLWVTVRNAGMDAKSMFWPGAEAAVRGVRPSDWSAFDSDLPIATRVDRVLGWLSADAAPRFVTLYLEHVDEAGHAFGPESAEALAEVDAVDRGIGALLDGIDARGLRDAVDVVVVSDHGMATVPVGHAIAVEDMVTVEQAVVTSTGQVIGVAPNPGHEVAVAQRLLANGGRHAQYDCWRREELPARWHFGTHRRVPPFVCQMHEGWDAIPRAGLARRPTDHPRGSHGFDPALPSMRAIFVARGPSFRRGVTLEPFDNIDVYPLLARLVGVAPQPNDGDPAALRPALVAP